ncbi:cation:proton antiporter [Kiloniella laminariae]|uniref:cation:proton antiporter n=1 Tax=Kiloniella laminariae TaxID=454162 RepID=UPI00035CB0C6|nr:cation:proton antiporter [Kiloniella laminariae]
MHDHSGSLTGLAIVILGALACGIAMRHFKQPPVLGYILAGVLLGPTGLGLVDNRDNISTLAELGVLMLLFVIGMELSLRGIKEVWKIALVTTALQIGVGVGGMLALGYALDWSIELSLFFGFVFALSSTAVAVKMLKEINEQNTRVGQVTIGILIAQDLAVVPMMLLVGSFGSEGGTGSEAIIKVGFSIAFLALLLAFLSKRRGLQIPLARSIGDNEDLTPLAGMAFCFGAAALSGIMGLSAAYGAFLAGLVLGNSASHKVMIRQVAPIQSILLMVFFLSIGLLLDAGYIWENFGLVFLLVLFVALFKTAFNIVLLRFLGESWPRAFISGALLAQLGEFSFILAALGIGAGVLSDDNYRLVVSVTVISLFTSPFWLFSARRLHQIAQLGVTSGRETMRLTYGPEVNAIRRASLTLQVFVATVLAKLGKPPQEPETTAEEPSKGGVAADHQDSSAPDDTPETDDAIDSAVKS